MPADALIYVVDDDPAALASMGAIFSPTGFSVRTFASGNDFLRQYLPGQRACLVLALRLPELDGLGVIERLAADAASLPIVVVASNADVRSCVRVLKMGVFDFLEKPVDEQELLRSVRKAMGAGTSANPRGFASISETLSILTPRDQEILQLLVEGMSLKQIAARCQITVQSVWRHEQSILKKLHVANKVELVRRLMGKELEEGGGPE